MSRNAARIFQPFCLRNSSRTLTNQCQGFLFWFFRQYFFNILCNREFLLYLPHAAHDRATALFFYVVKLYNVHAVLVTDFFIRIANFRGQIPC